MKRSSFLKLIGLAFAAPAAVVKAVEPSQVTEEPVAVSSLDELDKRIAAIHLLDKHQYNANPGDIIFCMDKMKAGYVLRKDSKNSVYVASIKKDYAERWSTMDYTPYVLLNHL
jgi:hypothetical protein